MAFQVPRYGQDGQALLMTHHAHGQSGRVNQSMTGAERYHWSAQALPDLA